MNLFLRLQSLSSVFPALFHGREIFTAYLLPFLWQSGDQHQVAEVVLQILTNIGAAAGSYSSQDNEDVSSSHCLSIPWWAADEEVIPRLVDRFVLKGNFIKFYYGNTLMLAADGFNDILIIFPN